MSTHPSRSDTKTKHTDFQIGYIWVALITAIFGGFSISGHLSFVIGFNLSLGKGFLSLIQTHGHLQLMGWTGLFIIGVSLHFIPRLSSIPISQPKLIRRVLWLIGIGLLLRMAAHPVLPYLNNDTLFLLCNWIVALSGILEWYGVLIYVSLLIGTVLGIQKVNKRAGLLLVRPYLGMMISGFFLYASISLVLLIQMALRKNVEVDQAWNEFAVHVFIGLVLFPVSFAFSIRTFPLYLRLPTANWGVHRVAYIYFLSFCLQTISTAPFNFFGKATFYLSSGGMLLRSGSILWIVWKLDILTRMRVHRAQQPKPDRRPTRPGLPDRGEFGRFERLIYSAYVWLVLGAVVEMLIGASMLVKISLPIGSDVVRHTYLLGFITNLILGMAVRMIPGFIKKKRIASTKLVDATFWLGNTATVGRLLPFIIPSFVFDAISLPTIIAETPFALSGILGMITVTCLAVNLWKTSRL